MQGMPPQSQMIQSNQLGGYAPTQQMAMIPSTNAVTALVLSIIGLVGGFFYGVGLLFSIPGLVMAYKARSITTQILGHPDSGMATAAMIVGWIGVAIGAIYVIAVLGVLFFIVVVLDGASL